MFLFTSLLYIRCFGDGVQKGSCGVFLLFCFAEGLPALGI